MELEKDKKKIIHAPLKLSKVNIRNPQVTNTFTRHQEQNRKKKKEKGGEGWEEGDPKPNKQ